MCSTFTQSLNVTGWELVKKYNFELMIQWKQLPWVQLPVKTAWRMVFQCLQAHVYADWSSVRLSFVCTAHTKILAHINDLMSTFDKRRPNSRWHGSTQKMYTSTRMLSMMILLTPDGIIIIWHYCNLEIKSWSLKVAWMNNTQKVQRSCKLCSGKSLS